MLCSNGFININPLGAEGLLTHPGAQLGGGSALILTQAGELPQLVFTDPSKGTSQGAGAWWLKGGRRQRLTSWPAGSGRGVVEA